MFICGHHAHTQIALACLWSSNKNPTKQCLATRAIALYWPLCLDRTHRSRWPAYGPPTWTQPHRALRPVDLRCIVWVALHGRPALMTGDLSCRADLRTGNVWCILTVRARLLNYLWWCPCKRWLAARTADSGSWWSCCHADLRTGDLLFNVAVQTRSLD